MCCLVALGVSAGKTRDSHPIGYGDPNTPSQPSASPGPPMNASELLLLARAWRAKLDHVFAPETAMGVFDPDCPARGHCATASAVLRARNAFPQAEFVSATVEGGSHWFLRIDDSWDVDVTADQFGSDAVRSAPAGELYPGTRVRSESELNEETRRRIALLAQRLDLKLAEAGDP